MSHAHGRLADDCLFCHEPIGEWHGASIRCPSCGEINLRVDQETFWTLSPRARRAERIATLVGTACIGAATLALLMIDATPTGTGWKVFAAMGALLPTVLWWDLTGLLTRRRSRTRIEVLVPAMFLVLGVGPILWAVFRALWGEPTDILLGFVQSLGVLVAVQPFVFSSWLLVTWVDRLRKRAAAAHLRRAADEARDATRLRAREPRGAAPAAAVARMRDARGLADAQPSATYGRVRTPDAQCYCLHCFAPMAPIAGAGARCDVCGEFNLRIDQDRYWTRNRRYLLLERGVKLVGVVAASLAVLLLLRSDAPIAGEVTWLGPLGVPLALVSLLLVWDLSGMITRRRSALHLELFLPVVVGGLGLTAVVLGRATLSIRGTIDDGPVHDALWLPWSFALPFLYAAPVAWLAMRWFQDWRASALELGLRRGRERMVASFEAARSVR